MNPESDDERRSRKLHELQGKNISHYNILLSAVIQSELDGVKNIINLSSAGIGFLFVLEKFGASSACGELSKILKMVIFIGFIVAIVFGISFLFAASKHYEKFLRENDDEECGKKLMQSRQAFVCRRKTSMLAFLAGITSLAVLGIIDLL
jgi:hypothetical protein